MIENGDKARLYDTIKDVDCIEKEVKDLNILTTTHTSEIKTLFMYQGGIKKILLTIAAGMLITLGSIWAMKFTNNPESERISKEQNDIKELVIELRKSVEKMQR